MATLQVQITNQSGIADDDVYLGFWGTQLNATINGAAMQSINSNVWYKLSDIQSFEMQDTTSGRIYVAYYDTFSPVAGGIPSIVSPSSPAYDKRFDKFELTFDGSPYGVADLTAIDFWSIPMSLATEQNGQQVATLDGVKPSSSINAIYKSLTPLSDPAQSQATGTEIINAFAAEGHALPTGVQQQIKDPASGLVNNSGGDFVRIIGPNVYPPFGDPMDNDPPGLPFTPYNTFLAYFQYLIATFGPGQSTPPGFTNLGNGKIAQVAGEYGGSATGSGPPFEKQSYDLWASITDDMTLTLQGTGSEVGAIKMTITKWNLLDPAATYGGNPSFSLNGGPNESPQNNLYAWILGDFFAGLNIGAIGSAVQVDGMVVGEMTSSQWFAKLPPAGKLFNTLWGGSITNYWNQWAQQLNPRSDAYNFAYAERFSAPQISLNPATVDTLTLILLTADVTS